MERIQAVLLSDDAPLLFLACMFLQLYHFLRYPRYWLHPGLELSQTIYGDEQG